MVVDTLPVLRVELLSENAAFDRKPCAATSCFWHVYCVPKEEVFIYNTQRKHTLSHLRNGPFYRPIAPWVNSESFHLQVRTLRATHTAGLIRPSRSVVRWLRSDRYQQLEHNQNQPTSGLDRSGPHKPHVVRHHVGSGTRSGPNLSVT